MLMTEVRLVVPLRESAGVDRRGQRRDFWVLRTLRS